jgi:hypothetical protein
VDQLVGEARLSNPDLQASVLLNRAPGNPALRRRKIETAVERLHSAAFQNLSVLETVIVERTVFQDNEEFGLTAWEPSILRGVIDASACGEVAALYKEIIGNDYTAGTVGAAA